MTVSAWVRSTNDLTVFEQEDVQNFVDVVDTGAQSRACSYTNSIVWYTGPRLTLAYRASPFNHSRTGLFYHDYHQDVQNESQLESICLASKINQAMDMVRQIGKQCNPEHTEVIGFDVCKRGILTGAAAARRKKIIDKEELVEFSGTNQCLGFCNSPHKDRLDVVTKKDDIDFFLNQENVKVTSRNYMRRVHETIGLALMTNCGHSLIGSLDSSETLIANFAQFDFSIPIKHQAAHTFYGHSFVHCTLLPIIVYSNCDNKYVRISNVGFEDRQVCVWAWGGYGGASEVTLERRRRQAMLEQRQRVGQNT